jgi:hypothetical protein
MGMMNVAVQVDAPPAIDYLITEDGALIEFHWSLADGSTLDLLMSPEVATLALAAGAVMRAQVEQESASDATI